MKLVKKKNKNKHPVKPRGLAKCINAIHIDKLKGLIDVPLEFSEGLTAIMGVNGVGKTTVIHALACLCQPLNPKNHDYRFSEFFTPNTHATWKGSQLTAYIVPSVDGQSGEPVPRIYKKTGHWAPRYNTRLRRDTYYIGIDTCLPEIENTTKTTQIRYKTDILTDSVSEDVIKKAAAVLNMDYDCLTDNIYSKKNMIGVMRNDKITYSSLSMGTGEQRVIKMLKTILRAKENSLILIDEIDLLLHNDALRRLLDELIKIAKKKQLQIIFTTHSTLLEEFEGKIKIQYIQKTFLPGTDHKMKFFVYDSVIDEELTGRPKKNKAIYVEDKFSAAIVKSIIRELKLSSDFDVLIFGAGSNAFSLAGTFAIEKRKPENNCIVLDGDLYRTENERRNQLNNKLTGTGSYIAECRQAAMQFITQYNLPEKTAPEKFMHDMLEKYGECDNQVTDAALSIKAVSNTHEWIDKIGKKIGEDDRYVIEEIIRQIRGKSEWADYISPIKRWLVNQNVATSHKVE